MRTAVFPGTFDPPTHGHMNLIDRAAKIFDTVYVVIAVNQNKECLFSADERQEMMTEMLSGYTNVVVKPWERLIVEFAQQHGAKVILRGVRALADFGYEFELAMTNKGLNPDIDILFMPTDPKYFVLRSSAIKEVALYGGDVTSMVPPNVAEALQKRLRGS
jgi:pantetheine-phosphate adenylyltransferase